MTAVGLRELRQDASDLVRRVEHGEQIDITVAGRFVARLVPSSPNRWLQWSQIASLFAGEADPDWHADAALIDHMPTDPWEPRR